MGRKKDRGADFIAGAFLILPCLICIFGCVPVAKFGVLHYEESFFGMLSGFTTIRPFGFLFTFEPDIKGKEKITFKDIEVPLQEKRVEYFRNFFLINKNRMLLCGQSKLYLFFKERKLSVKLLKICDIFGRLSAE